MSQPQKRLRSIDDQPPEQHAPLPLADDEAQQRELIANAAWSTLSREGLRLALGGQGYKFRYSGRSYTLRCPAADHGKGSRTWTVEPSVAPDSHPFDSGITWQGRGRKAAVVAMARYAYGRLCPHQYVTGRDTCPNCDIYDAG
ncbi:hypothetical protein ACH4PU_30830 [Streptomyces sp. NPDC021100]|uniref:hypothetical protein n=1 Tax=Streptomyces sp. NPDC021100 TaxID=3365114 RepID=UPI0037B9B2C3